MVGTGRVASVSVASRRVGGELVGCFLVRGTCVAWLVPAVCLSAMSLPWILRIPGAISCPMSRKKSRPRMTSSQVKKWRRPVTPLNWKGNLTTALTPCAIVACRLTANICPVDLSVFAYALLLKVLVAPVSTMAWTGFLARAIWAMIFCLLDELNLVYMEEACPP